MFHIAIRKLNWQQALQDLFFPYCVQIANIILLKCIIAFKHYSFSKIYLVIKRQKCNHLLLLEQFIRKSCIEGQQPREKKLLLYFFLSDPSPFPFPENFFRQYLFPKSIQPLSPRLTHYHYGPASSQMSFCLPAWCHSRFLGVHLHKALLYSCYYAFT